MDYMTTKNDEIGLSELFAAIWRAKFWIAGTSFAFAVMVAVYAVSLPNIYRAEVKLTPAADGAAGKLGALAGQFGGLASLAGINLGGGDSNKTALALETMKSRAFFASFMQKHNVLIPLFAAKEWQPETNQLVLDNSIYDENAEKWVRDVSYPKQTVPTVQEAHGEFAKVFSVNQDKLTGFVTLTVEHVSPYIAKEWAESLVKDINQVMREMETREAQDSIDYLQKQIDLTQVTEIRSVLYQLIEEQTKTLMLANVRPEYVLKTIEPAVVPERKYKPGRALMVIGAAILTGILGIGIVLIRLVLSKE